MSEAHVTTTIENGIATIEFFTPEHNALPSEILNQLEHEIISAGTKDSVQIIVLKSGGDRTFCAGRP